MKFRAAFTFLFFALSARANILFVDINRADAEVQAARQAAEARGLKLIVIPTEEQRSQLAVRAALNTQVATLETEYDQLGCNAKTKPRCREIDREVPRLKKERDGQPAFTANQLKAELARLKLPITSVMISGHDGGGDIYGDFGFFSTEDFRAAFQNTKTNDVKSIYLLGCRSTVKENLGDTWLRTFPKARMILGYDMTGYLRENAGAHRMVTEALAMEPRILAAATISEAQELIKELGKPGGSKYSVGACLQRSDKVSEAYYVSSDPKKRSGKVAELNGCKTEGLKESLQILDCVQNDGACSLSRAAALKVEAKLPKGCGFVFPENYQVNVQRLYYLQNLSDPQSELFYRNVFKKAPPSLQKLLKLDEEPETYADLKKKVKSLRDYYQANSSFDRIGKMNSQELRAFAGEKDYFDRTWLAISNLSLSEGEQLRYFSSDTYGKAGAIRAQSFLNSLGKDRKEAVRKRIAELKLAENEASDTRPLLRSEIGVLEQALRESVPEVKKKGWSFPFFN